MVLIWLDIIQFLVKSVRPFRIYRQLKYLTFDFWRFDITEFYFLINLFRLLYGASFSKIRQAAMIYRRINYLQFGFGLWPWGQGKKVLLFSFLWLLSGANFSKIRQAVQDLSQNELQSTIGVHANSVLVVVVLVTFDNDFWHWVKVTIFCFLI